MLSSMECGKKNFREFLTTLILLWNFRVKISFIILSFVTKNILLISENFAKYATIDRRGRKYFVKIIPMYKVKFFIQ